MQIFFTLEVLLDTFEQFLSKFPMILRIHSPMEKNAVVVMKGGSSGAEAKETAFAFPTPTVKLQDKRNSTEYDPNLPFHHYRV